MSHKGVRHHLVSQSHHHRWASRRSVTHLQHHLRACRPVPTSAHHSSRSRVSHHNPTPKPSTRGSFDAFIAAEKSPQTISRGSFDAFIASQKPNSEQSQSSNQNVLQNLTEPGDQRLIHPYFADLGLPQGSLHNSLMYHVLQLKIATMIYNKQTPEADLAAAFHLRDFIKNSNQESSSSDTIDSSAKQNVSQSWVDTCSQHFSLPLVTLSSDQPPSHSSLKSTVELHNLFETTLISQNDLAAHCINQLSEYLSTYNDQVINFVQGTTEPEFFTDIHFHTNSLHPATSSEATNRVSLDLYTTIPKYMFWNDTFLKNMQICSNMNAITSQFANVSSPTIDLATFYPEWRNIHARAFNWA